MGSHHKPCCGTKAFSEDGLHWEWAGNSAFDYTVPLANGTTLRYLKKEEPKLLMQNGRPTHLFAVVSPSLHDDGYSNQHIIVQELDYSDTKAPGFKDAVMILIGAGVVAVLVVGAV